jgi:uncharacterized protein YdcH (DUF465 family)
MGIERLHALDRRCERLLKDEIDRVSAQDVRFARVLREALTVEDEIIRRERPKSPEA